MKKLNTDVFEDPGNVKIFDPAKKVLAVSVMQLSKSNKLVNAPNIEKHSARINPFVEIDQPEHLQTDRNDLNSPEDQVGNLNSPSFGKSPPKFNVTSEIMLPNFHKISSPMNNEWFENESQ